MAFALAIKSKFDFPEVGSMFLLITLIVTAFTLIYSSFFLNKTLNSCGIIINQQNEIILNEYNYMPNIPNIFENIKDKFYSFHTIYLLPIVNREKENGDLKEKLKIDFS
jgi:hypothetical protein